MILTRSFNIFDQGLFLGRISCFSSSLFDKGFILVKVFAVGFVPRKMPSIEASLIQDSDLILVDSLDGSKFTDDDHIINYVRLHYVHNLSVSKV